MPDVTRSDSQRSDTSLRPRVSFNRDVHVKRIVPREAARSALVTSDEGHFGSLVRKERLPKNKDQLKKEAAKVIDQVDKIDCISKNKGVHPEKFYTLPARRKHQSNPEFAEHSLERRSGRRNSIELTLTPPKKPPRTFATSTPKANNSQRSSIFNIFQKDKEKEVKPKKSNLRRSVSDATNLKSNDAQQHKLQSTNENEHGNVKHNKKQLSPIIEITQREDYFTNLKPSTSFKENDKNVDNENKSPRKGTKSSKPSVTEQLKEYIDEIDSALLNETNKKPPLKEKERKKAEVVIIDVDKAEKISGKNKSKLNTSIGKKLKSIATKKGKKTKEIKKEILKPEPVQEEKSVSTIKQTIENLENQANKSPEMIHSSQQPVEKLPLTRGRTVDTMVKRLSHESNSPPPKSNIMVTPNVTVQHNNNQPFSYTRALSPDRSPTVPTNPIIYAQVVCGNNGSGTKQTIHTTYTNGKKHLPHSDSDEGLGYEENSGFRNSEKSITHFGDGKYKSDFYHDDRYEEEYPITPNFKSNNGFNGFNSYETKYSKMDQGIFIDSTSRGRGDGMDAKRRESLTEPIENGMNSKFNGSSTNLNPRKDLSARRDLLESRINRRFGEKPVNSPEYSPKANVYVTETTSRYYRSGSASPIGVREKVVTETKTDRRGNQYTTNVHTKKYLGDERDGYKIDEYRYSYDNEPKSFDSQVSDYRSSPENTNKHFETSHRTSHHSKYTSKGELSKDRDFYKSNPEITQRHYNYDSHMRLDDSYHDSLKRDAIANGKHKERYFDHSESERKDKFGDSGIENDFRRDSGERRQKRREFSNESEDEGFASSLLIASERQHTEDNFARKNRRSYDSERGYHKDDDYRNSENSEYRSYRNKHEYIPRERSIDDGSHFDPRIDKNLEKDRSTLRKVEKKPPKPEKKSSLEKMKQLFSSSKKKKDKPGMVREESLRARYTEYRGHQVEPKLFKKEVSEANTGYDYNSRRRLSTPSPSPTRELPRNGKNDATHGSWFKSLDRLSRKKTKKDEKEGNVTSTEDEISKPTKSLRFFGDTDIESNDSIRHKSVLKSRSGLSHRDRTRSQSSRDLHNISEESHKSSHKSMLNIPAESDRDAKGSRLSLKPPASPSHRNRELSRSREDRSRRRKNEVSSVESSTEGDSSQQSQRSVVYLHAATVGDIPGPGYLRNGRRAASREELTSNTSSRIQPQVKTLSRSFSVLAPWKPKHYKEGVDIDYTQYPSKPVKNGKYEQNKNGSSRKEATSTLKKKAQETRRSNQNVSSTLNRKSKSKENVSTLKRTSESKGSSSSLYKKRERQPKENNRYNRDDKKISSKSMSVESLGSNKSGRKSDREISRSISMPRDPEKSAGWFTMTKKSKKSGSTQRL